MSRAVAYYDSVYLVAFQDQSHSKHRVTTRGPGQQRPGVVQFSGNFPVPVGDDTYSTLVLDEAKWEKWFGGRTLVPGMTTAVEAATTMVETNANINYGCPLCAVRGSDREKIEAHIHEHINKFVSQFRIEIEED